MGSTRWVLQVVELAGMVTGPGPRARSPEGQYVKAIDPDAHAGGGFVDLTDKIADARLFASHAEALAYWQRQSTVRPFREDGRPNRPGTAFTVELIPVQIASGNA